MILFATLLAVQAAPAAPENWPQSAATYERAGNHAAAGNAWLAAGDFARARAAFDTALASATLPDAARGQLHLDRGRALVLATDLVAARRDFDKALELLPREGFAFFASAALARRQEDLRRAQEDIAQAVALAPGDPDILIEAGNIAAISGEIDAAKALWLRAAEAAPGSDAARRALAAVAAN